MYRNFIKNILPIHNRLADGPSVEMIKKIKKLILNNTIDFSLKDQNKIIKIKKNLYLKKSNKYLKIDFIFSAIANLYKENINGDKLLINMYRNNLISLNKFRGHNYAFLNLDKNQSPYNKNSKKNNDITFIGPASEAQNFSSYIIKTRQKTIQYYRFRKLDKENLIKNFLLVY